MARQIQIVLNTKICYLSSLYFFMTGHKKYIKYGWTKTFRKVLRFSFNLNLFFQLYSIVHWYTKTHCLEDNFKCQEHLHVIRTEFNGFLFYNTLILEVILKYYHN